MSVKIYDGLVSAALNDPFELADAIRKIVEPMFHKRFKELVEGLKKSSDDLTWGQLTLLGLKGWDNKLIKDARLLDWEAYEFVKAIDESSTKTISEFGIGYTICLMPNSETGLPLVLLYSEKGDWYREALMAAGVVRDYGYWDNTDPDEDASEEEWEERKKAWSLLFDKSPSAAGLTINFPSSIEAAIELRRK